MKNEEISKLIAKNLLQINAIIINAQNPFTWASGIKSPIYCDNRLTLSHVEVRQLIIEGFEKKSTEFGDFDVIGGVATAGIPHGALLAAKLGLPFIYVRAAAKDHGKKNLIEGRLLPGQKVLLIEDLISTGGSSLKAVEAVREYGNEVAGVLAIFSYEFDSATRAFAAGNCPFSTLSSYSTMLGQALEDKKITDDQLELLMKWKKDPENWGK
jgi:orotate phosphoribosyltransferase